MKNKFKISWNMMFMAISSELLCLFSFILINSPVKEISQVGYFFIVPSFLFLIITVMYWIEVYYIGEKKLKAQLNRPGGYPLN